MKLFKMRELREAYDHTMAGDQALHVMDGRIAHAIPTAPKCFLNRSQIAHLFDMDKSRLIATAKRLGVRVIKVERDGTVSQHIDLCGKPLEKAIAETIT